jgi:hypothetical protein
VVFPRCTVFACLVSCSALAVRACTVSFVGPSGVPHSIDVTAESVYEAAALGLSRLRRDEWADQIAPSARPSAGSRGGHCAGRVAERTSISAQLTADASVVGCWAWRMWRCPARPHGPLDTRARRGVGDRRRSNAADARRTGGAGAGSLRSGTRPPTAPGDPASR